MGDKNTACTAAARDGGLGSDGGTAAVQRVSIRRQGEEPLRDYREAMTLAEAEASARLDDPMLLSWYDRDRDFESPQHASECHRDSAVPGYVDYALHRGATLRVDVEEGRFVFFYMPVEL